jgi:hypothetical protein
MCRWVIILGLALNLVVLATFGFEMAGWSWPNVITRAPPPNSPIKEKPLKLPDWWKAEDPLPMEKTNCVRCHLNAGRELTLPVRDFARSVHDLAHMSCNDCHGGNIKEDGAAHEPEHHFIGTKLSAHMANCSKCHGNEAQELRKGKHFWDLDKGINRKYPVCVDCHGNHDIGKPPVDFTLTNVCTDCHKSFAKDMSQTAGVVTENDRLWQVLRKVQEKNKAAANPVPAPMQKDVNRIRSKTARFMHRAAPIAEDQANVLNDQTRQLREKLETWLKNQK